MVRTSRFPSSQPLAWSLVTDNRLWIWLSWHKRTQNDRNWHKMTHKAHEMTWNDTKWQQKLLNLPQSPSGRRPTVHPCVLPKSKLNSPQCSGQAPSKSVCCRKENECGQRVAEKQMCAAEKTICSKTNTNCFHRMCCRKVNPRHLKQRH